MRPLGYTIASYSKPENLCLHLNKIGLGFFLHKNNVCLDYDTCKSPFPSPFQIRIDNFLCRRVLTGEYVEVRNVSPVVRLFNRHNLYNLQLWGRVKEILMEC